MIVADPAPAPASGPFGKLAAYVRHHIPTRETIEANRFLRPVAHRILMPSLWRFNRRSVPRGVALGVATSVLVPVAHMPAAAILSIPLRANLPTAVGITIPSTFLLPAIWLAAYRIGHWVLRIDRGVPGAPISNNIKANAGWLHWLFAQAGPSTIVGLIILAAVLSVTGYFATKLLWRLKISRKWRSRRVKTSI